MKTLKRNTNRILSMLFAIFMTVCAFLSLTALLPKASASADETIDIEAVFNNCTFEPYKEGDSIGGKYFCMTANNWSSLSITESKLEIIDCGFFKFVPEQETGYYKLKYNDVYWPYAFTIDGNNKFGCIYIPEDCSEYGFDASTATFNTVSPIMILEMRPLPSNLDKWTKTEYISGSDPRGKLLRIEALNPTGDEDFYQKVFVSTYSEDTPRYLSYGLPFPIFTIEEGQAPDVNMQYFKITTGGIDAAILYVPEYWNNVTSGPIAYLNEIYENGLMGEVSTTDLSPGYKIYELTEPAGGSGAPDSVPGGSSINPNGPGKAESVSEWELFGLVALSIFELACVVAYIAKAPNGGAKWIFTLILLGVFVAADIGLYLYFAGLI